MFVGRQVATPLHTSRTYFDIDIVLAVLYHLDVGSVDGLLVVLDTSRPVSSRAEQLQGRNEHMGDTRCYYSEVNPSFFKTTE